MTTASLSLYPRGFQARASKLTISQPSLPLTLGGIPCGDSIFQMRRPRHEGLTAGLHLSMHCPMVFFLQLSLEH